MSDYLIVVLIGIANQEEKKAQETNILELHMWHI